ncbi:MAG: hypothetical protein CR994_08905 [Maribacter sp.]|nr:MAG: hypothetical protein CR994_08905 [Maribacter sp.]
MNKFKSHFSFSEQEKSGIFFLLLIIVVLQVVFYFVKNTSGTLGPSLTIDKETQVKLDSLKRAALRKAPARLFPFNPNYISDYKGYTLGMTPEEIDRLHSYRERNLYVNNAEEFRKVTRIPDSLLDRISPYFEFPEWTKDKPKAKIVPHFPEPGGYSGKNEKGTQLKDLNFVTADELRSIKGIGDKLSQRIIRFRDGLGGFYVGEQLYDVYALEPEVVQRALERYAVLSQPPIRKININTASVSEISNLIYIPYPLALRIVEYRENNGAFTSFGELTKIEGFPVQKIDRIKLYLKL